MTRSTGQTTEDGSTLAVRTHRRGDPAPGVVLVYSADQPRCDALPLHRGELVLGRGDLAALGIDDAQVSRRHTRVRHTPAGWVIEDLESRNGTRVDGRAVDVASADPAARVLRTGASIFLLVADVTPYRDGISAVGGTIVGPTLARVWDRIGRTAHAGTTLHVRGESGTGKELAARAFHRLGPRASGPFVAVNCAAIPASVAERLLLGARKGAFSGATADADGYLQAAHGGVLFLDEIAELELAVQAKLLRALESREVLPLGATRPVPVEFALISATHADLRAHVAAGRLREDLFFRVGRPEVLLPPLRERAEEIPWLAIASVRDEPGVPRLHASLIEACLLRLWPGNVRELVAEIRGAAHEAASAGSPWVDAVHLAARAGLPFGAETAPPAETSLSTLVAGRRRAPSLPADDVIEAALLREEGNISRAARALGMHRTQLRRWLARR